MNPSPPSAARTLTILGGTAVMLSLAMGMRQSWGLLQPHVIRDVGLSAADFSLAIAMQNIVWGATQPFFGAIADQRGPGKVALLGILIYAAGIVLSMMATSAFMFILGAGVCIGLALSCTGSNIAMNITVRTASLARRSLAMGAVGAIGSLGMSFCSPIAQHLITTQGWKVALIGFLGLVAAMIPAALLAGGADRIDQRLAHGPSQSVGEAVREALGHRGYVVLATAYFVCGLQLVFLTTHLPTYLDICGVNPAVAASALALIGVFNVFGSFLFGWLGGRYSKRVLLGGIYLLRSLFITIYFLTPPTVTSTLVFAAAMGSLWLGVVPLVTGLVVHLFGARYMATLAGIALFSHQLGSFVGAWGGGLILERTGAYDYAWQGAVAIGIAAGLFQMTMNVRPSARMLRERAASPSAS